MFQKLTGFYQIPAVKPQILENDRMRGMMVAVHAQILLNSTTSKMDSRPISIPNKSYKNPESPAKSRISSEKNS